MNKALLARNVMADRTECHSDLTFLVNARVAAPCALLLLPAPTVIASPSSPPVASATAPPALGIRFVEGSTSTVILQRDGKEYLVELANQTVKESTRPAAQGQTYVQNTNPPSAGQSESASVFRQHCARRHGADGKGIAGVGTPDFTDPKVLKNLTDEEIIDTITQGRKGTKMNGNAPQMKSGAAEKQIQAGNRTQPEEQAKSKIYEPGDDALVTISTGRRLDRHGLYVNFTHRFAFDALFSGPARGCDLLGLDGFALASFGFGYGVTKNFSIDVYRSPAVALPAEVIPPLAGGRELNIDRPSLAFGIQKKTLRHAFTSGVTNAPELPLRSDPEPAQHTWANRVRTSPADFFWGST